jgi:hypothetical protein
MSNLSEAEQVKEISNALAERFADLYEQYGSIPRHVAMISVTMLLVELISALNRHSSNMDNRKLYADTIEFVVERLKYNAKLYPNKN